MYEIYAYDNVDALFGIFNAIAAIMGAGDYLDSVRIVIVMGFMTALLVTALNLRHAHGWQWLLGIFLIYNVLLVPKVTVGIVDRLAASPTKVVANVPFGVALFGHVTSKLGDVLTTLFEGAFQTLPGEAQLPADLGYQGNGVMFGSRLVKASRAAMIHDPQLRTDMINFVHNCTMYDLVDGTLDPKTFAQSNNLWSLMNTTNPARFTNVWNYGSASYDVLTCKDAYTALNTRLPGAVSEARAKIAFAINAARDDTAAVGLIDTQLEAAYAKNKINSTALAAADILRQNMLINVIMDAGLMGSTKLNDPTGATLGVARAQATAQVNAGYMMQGRIAEEALPLIRNVIEGILYAVFPLSFLLMMVLQGKSLIIAVKSYVFALIWIQLWPPLYAVVNYFSTLATAKNIAAAAKLGPGAAAIALETANGIYTNAVSDLAVAGYMVLAIIPLSWALLKGMEAVGQAAITGINAIQSAAMGAGAQAALGNIGAGNVSFDQGRLSPMRTSAALSVMQDGYGDTTTQRGDHLMAYTTLKNSVPFTGSQSAERFSGVAEEASRHIEAGRRESVQAASETVAALSETVMKSKDRFNVQDYGHGISAAEMGALQETAQSVRSRATDLSRRYGISEVDAASLVFAAGAGLGFDAAARASKGSQLSGSRATGNGIMDSVGSNATESINSGAGMGANARFGANLDQNYAAKLARAYDELVKNTDQEAAGRLREYAHRTASDEHFRSAVISRQGDVQSINAQFSSARKHLEQASTDFASGKRLQESARFGKQSRDGMGFSWIEDPQNAELVRDLLKETRGMSPHQAQVHMENRLAERGLLSRPTKYLSDAHVVWDERQLRNDHDTDKASGDLRETDRANRGKVGGREALAVSAPHSLNDRVSSDIDGAKQEAAGKYRAFAKQQVKAQQRFETETGVHGDRDGKFGSRKSTADRAAANAADDAKRSNENLLDAVEDATFGTVYRLFNPGEKKQGGK